MSRDQRCFDPIELRPETARHVARRRAIHHQAAKAERELPRWETAIECLMLVGEHGGDPMLPRIAMMQALQRDEPKVAAAPHRPRSTRSFGMPSGIFLMRGLAGVND